MAKSLQTLAKELGKNIPNPGVQGTRIAFGVGKKANKEVTELLGYDFTSLLVKVFIFYTVAFAIAKFFEAIIFFRGGFVIAAKLFGINLPKKSELPDFIVKMFETGFDLGGNLDRKIKYWDIINAIAIVLIAWEYFRFKKSEEAIGGNVSPFTTAIFSLIIGALAIFSFNELLTKIKSMQTSFSRKTQEDLR